VSFFTTLHFYRPTPPPVVTGESLVNFVEAFRRLGVSTDDGPLTVDVKFGSRIDQDQKQSLWEEPLGEGVAVIKDLEWDLTVKCQSLHQVSDALAKQKETVYRAFVQLGSTTEEVYNSLERKNSPENEVDLAVDSWSLEIGPITSSSLVCDDEFFVGWMSVNISGNGYLFPWTLAELIRRAEGNSRIRQVMELCKATWPVDPKPPDQEQKEMRQRMSDLWPYADIGLPWDWYWGVNESG
jgi:hypothetical protein